MIYKFQSTLPARGATNLFFEAIRIIKISIHAPRTGSDEALEEAVALRAYFNPRSPHGERPWTAGMLSWTRRISIHAPRTGSDMETYMSLITRSNFNPRSPHGERPGGRYKIRAPDNFNPRSPHGERHSC